MIQLKGIKAAIIDLDGTMIDTIGDFLVAINAMRDEFSLAPLTSAAIKNKVGKGSEHLIRQVLACGFSEAEALHHFDAAMESYQRHYLAVNGRHSALFPDVKEGLDAMQRRGIRLACVTNKPIAFTLPLLKKMCLNHFFDVIYGGDSLPKKKPHPLPFLQVCDDFSLTPDQIVAIGDSCYDIEAARAAGCWSLIVPYGYNHGEAVQQILSDGIVDNLLCAALMIG